MTFQAYAVGWLDRRRKAGLRSIGDYESLLRNHVLPQWARYELTEIRPLAVRRWVDELRASSLAPRTARNIYGLMRNIMTPSNTREAYWVVSVEAIARELSKVDFGGEL